MEQQFSLNNGIFNGNFKSLFGYEIIESICPENYIIFHLPCGVVFADCINYVFNEKTLVGGDWFFPWYKKINIYAKDRGEEATTSPPPPGWISSGYYEFATNFCSEYCFVFCHFAELCSTMRVLDTGYWQQMRVKRVSQLANKHKLANLNGPMKPHVHFPTKTETETQNHKSSYNAYIRRRTFLNYDSNYFLADLSTISCYSCSTLNFLSILCHLQALEVLFLLANTEISYFTQ